MTEIFLPADTPDGMRALMAGAAGLNESNADLRVIINGLNTSGMQGQLLNGLLAVQQTSERLVEDIAASLAGLGRGGMQGHDDLHAIDANYGRQAEDLIT